MNGPLHVLALLAVVVGPAVADLQPVNVGGEDAFVFQGHRLDTVRMDVGPAVLYAPSHGDDPSYRARIATEIGGTCDYYDARAGTPSLDLLLDYDCVIVWANFPFFEAERYGDVLAAYADLGGNVILGVFCTYTRGNHLTGAIMSADYCPVTSPTGDNHFSESSYAGDGRDCMHDDVEDYACAYRDILVLHGDGLQDGAYLDGEIAAAINPSNGVQYHNGTGAAGFGGTGDWAELNANGCRCTPPTNPVDVLSWGRLKATY